MPVKPRKSWAEKLADDKDLPKVITLTGAAVKRWGGRTLVIAAPREIDALMRTVPRGRVTTINELRARLARKHGADTACPITTGIFSWIAAHAAAEAAVAGAKKITPYWRTLKTGGEINPKYPGGVAAGRKLLAAEGHAFVRQGARVLVKDFTARLSAPKIKPRTGEGKSAQS
jgi:alkylated DNA nucleotide flippase Atl1